MKLSRSFGQVFLRNKKYIGKIVEQLEVNDEVVCEVGSGDGTLTQHLLDKARFVYCLEVDGRWCRHLEKKFSQSTNIKIIYGDILKFSLSPLKRKIVIVGNIPYHITNQFFHYMVAQKQWILRAYLTVQREVAQKLVASPLTKEYSFLSCYLQYYAKLIKIFDIPRAAFFPSPRVDSSFICMEFYPFLTLTAHDEGLLFSLIRGAFSQRRKKIVNSLARFKINASLFKEVGIDPSLRADALPLEKYVYLANAVYEQKQKG